MRAPLTWVMATDPAAIGGTMPIPVTASIVTADASVYVVPSIMISALSEVTWVVPVTVTVRGWMLIAPVIMPAALASVTAPPSK